MRRRRVTSSETDEWDRSANERPPDATSVGHKTRATAGERKEHPSPKGALFYKIRVFVFWFAIIGSGALFSLHYLRGQRLLTGNNGDTTTTSQPTGASLRAHTAMPTAAPIAQAVPESSRKVFQKPKAYIGEEPNEHLELLQAFDDKVDRLVRELEIALENAGPVWAQSKQGTDEIAMAKAQQRIQQRIFDEMEFEDGVETYGMSLGDPYYAFDDDEVRTSGSEEWYLKGCRRTAIHRQQNPTCNKMHEQDVPSFLVQQWSNYLGSGAFRDAFFIPASMVQDADSGNVTGAVFKSMLLSNEDYDFDLSSHIEMSRIDALVMDLLSASPRITNIYGYCGQGSITEFCPTQVEKVILKREYDDGKFLPGEEDEPTTRNDLTVIEKLQFALDFARPLAEMHGMKEGMMLHVDVKPDQYLRGYDGIVKLIDFNRAEPLLYDEETGKHCSQNEGGAYTVYRAPEEMKDGQPQDDKADVFNYASLIYTVLTGLWVHSGFDESQVRKDLMAGIKPFYDKRWAYKSLGEAAILRVIDEGWNFDPEERPTMFEIIDILEEALAKQMEFEARGITGDEWRQHLSQLTSSGENISQIQTKE